MIDALKDLQDFPALQQLGRALWRDGSARGAALMVGSGFSRNAILPGLDTKAPPLWKSLIDEMLERLYGNSGDRPTNALRIAEEYRIYFGQAALDEFIRTRCPDKAWQPGALHVDFLKLPWADVLTTNWDTLLERAAERVEQAYEVVALEADLPHARAPRIVKLHGSLGDAGPLIFAEEDYRTYPEKHAAFLNLARQVFVENELCLVGFSGDDPNFLQWAGWVRDHLGGKARRIYLVGCLKLSASKRKYLEAHNVSPIDLSPLVEADAPDKHERVTRIFLQALVAARPNAAHEWKLHQPEDYPLSKGGADAYSRTVKDSDFCADALKETTELWRQDRRRYPGWLVCPQELRALLQTDMDEAWIFRPEALLKLSHQERTDALYELAWRRTTSGKPMTQLAIGAVTELLQAHWSDVAPDTRGFLTVVLLRDARLSFDKASFDDWAKKFDNAAELHEKWGLDCWYQKALFARDRGRLSEVLELADQIKTDDAVWKLRRAALYAEAGRYIQATQHIKEAAGELDRAHRLDRSSVWVQARLGWAELINRGTIAANWALRKDLPPARDFTAAQVDPHKELEGISASAQRIQNEQREKAVTMVPLFDAGRYRPVSRPKSREIEEGWLMPGLELDYMMESTGLPLRINSAGYCTHVLLQTLEICYQPTFQWYAAALRGLHSHFDKEFERWFSRLLIAQLEDGVARELITLVRTMVEYWRDRLVDTKGADFRDERGIAIDELRLYLVALARLSVRMTEVEASDLFKQAIGWATNSELQHHWILDALKEVGKYSAQSISRAGQERVAWSAASFLLSHEASQEKHFWPEFVEMVWQATPDMSARNAAWKLRVQELTAAAGKGRPDRSEAIMRLTFLMLRGALDDGEQARFGDALWSDVDKEKSGLPSGTNLLSSTIALLPAPDTVDAHALVREVLFAAPIENILRVPNSIGSKEVEERQSFIMALQHAAQLDLKPKSYEAARMFDEFLAWGPEAAPTSSRANAFGSDLGPWIWERSGYIISELLLPAMSEKEKTSERGAALLEAVERNYGWAGIAGLCFFLKSIAGLDKTLARLIMKGFIAPNHKGVSSATSAVQMWAKHEEHVGVSIPDNVYNRLVSAIEVAPEHGLNALLRCARVLVKTGRLSLSYAERLEHSLSDLLTQTDYQEVDPLSIRAISVSLVRAECVRLASVLLREVDGDDTLGIWLSQTKLDSLPEVRFALQDFEN
ncbi:SIR2 family protein [Caballeronia sp. dw_276]|uniref:SIR2 family NAD-dependent protein deacylase n=1 Tax=Caballeronia sp. dw_276 TaxID=2719795 RepID=UPI001BD3E9F0|nr:SIR2 family protein [Caballeronia sp. dw_276]